VAEGTPSSLKAQDRSHLRLQVMLAPGASAPVMPEWAAASTQVGHNLITTIPQDRATAGIEWAASLIGQGLAEEYALGATTLEDAYIRFTSHLSEDQGEGPGK